MEEIKKLYFKHPKIIKILIVCLIPCFLLILKFQVIMARGPYWISPDPSYIYLMNSLCITQFESSGYFHHPGTTVQIFGAGIITIWNILFGKFEVVKDVLMNPEEYLNVIQFAILLLYIAVLIWGTYKVYQITKRLFLCLFLQLPILLSNQCFDSFNVYSAEAFLVLASFILSVIIIMCLYKRQDNSKIYNYMFGAIIGFFLATKISSFPILIIPFIILENNQDRFRYSISLVISFLILTTPILTKYLHFILWTWNLLIHKGHYGHGERGVIDFNRYFKILFNILSDQQLFVLILIMSIIVIGVLIFLKHKQKIDRQHDRESKCLFALILTALLQFIIVAKHPMGRYLIPVISLSGLFLFLIGSAIERIHKTRGTAFIAVVFLGTIYVSIFHVIPSIDGKISMSNEQTLFHTNLEKLRKEKYQDYIPIFAYGSSSKEYALAFGNMFAVGKFTNKLNMLYPNVMFFNTWTKKFYKFEMKRDCVVNSLNLPEGIPYGIKRIDVTRCRNKTIELDLKRLLNENGDHKLVFKGNATVKREDEDYFKPYYLIPKEGSDRQRFYVLSKTEK